LTAEEYFEEVRDFITEGGLELRYYSLWLIGTDSLPLLADDDRERDIRNDKQSAPRPGTLEKVINTWSSYLTDGATYNVVWNLDATDQETMWKLFSRLRKVGECVRGTLGDRPPVAPAYCNYIRHFALSGIIDDSGDVSSITNPGPDELAVLEEYKAKVTSAKVSLIPYNQFNPPCPVKTIAARRLLQYFARDRTILVFRPRDPDTGKRLDEKRYPTEATEGGRGRTSRSASPELLFRWKEPAHCLELGKIVENFLSEQEPAADGARTQRHGRKK
jgi:hypothetical protein